MTCRMERELGAYVLHALERDETTAMTDHLNDCVSCRAELEQLESTASLLALLGPQDADRLWPIEQPAPPARGHRRASMLVVAAVTIVLTAAAAGVVLHRGSGPDQPSVVRAAGSAADTRATAAMSELPVATRVHVHVTGVPAGGWCSLIARSSDGQSEVAATWRADQKGTADVTGTTGIPATQLSELDVVTDAGQLLVRIPVGHTGTDTPNNGRNP